VVGVSSPGCHLIVQQAPLALATVTDQLLFDEHERQPDDELAHAFEAASTRLDPESRTHLKATLEGFLLRAETRRRAS
jgi:hypothetical protein